MALTNSGRTPGPAGTFRDLEDDIVFSYPGARPRLPGPSGTGVRGPLFWDSGNAQPSQPSLPPVKLEEPESTLVIGSSLDLLPEIALPFIGNPKPEDVVQGGLPNCPLHAILVAMAHAKPERLSKMLSRTSATVISTLADDEKFRKQTNVLLTVQFYDAKPIEISTLLYHKPVNKGGEDDDKGGGLVYARSNNGSWVSFFEKAYVKGYSKNSYKILANTGTRDAGKVMADVAGPHLFADLSKGNGKERLFTTEGKDKDLSDKLLADILKDAKQRPTIAGSPKTVPDQKIVGHHGYGVLGFDGKKVHLRNPWGANDSTNPDVVFLSLADFKKNFIAVLQATS